MNFDELKVIWDSQNEEPHYAVNEESLHSIFRAKSEKLRRLIFWQEIQTYGSSGLVLGVITIILLAHGAGILTQVSSRWNALTQFDVLTLFVAASGWLYFAGSIYWNRMKQRQRNAEYTSSLRDELDRDIQQVNYEIKARQHLVRGFLPPYTGGILFMWVFFRMSGAPGWAILPFICFMIGGLIFESRSHQKLVDRELIPRRQDLESLRNKLVSAEA